MLGLPGGLLVLWYRTRAGRCQLTAPCTRHAAGTDVLRHSLPQSRTSRRCRGVPALPGRGCPVGTAIAQRKRGEPCSVCSGRRCHRGRCRANSRGQARLCVEPPGAGPSVKPRGRERLLCAARGCQFSFFRLQELLEVSRAQDSPEPLRLRLSNKSLKQEWYFQNYFAFSEDYCQEMKECTLRRERYLKCINKN